MNEQCIQCGYEDGEPEGIDANGYCWNCGTAYDNGHATGFMEALQELAGIDPSELSDLDKLSGNERYALFARLLNGTTSHYKCQCRSCDCQKNDEFVNGETDENGICEFCFREHTEMDN